MCAIAGFPRRQITSLCAMIRQEAASRPSGGWPPVPGLFRSAVVALTYMRRNRVQQENEQTIADFKTRRIIHTDYRRPTKTFPQTISAVIPLHFHKRGDCKSFGSVLHPVVTECHAACVRVAVR